jgi:hypothetical protein
MNASPVPLPELTRAQEKRLGRWGTRYRNLVRRCWCGMASPRQAIKAQCLDCQGEDRQAVASCGDRCCPLWRFRPFQPKAPQAVPPASKRAVVAS